MSLAYRPMNMDTEMMHPRNITQRMVALLFMAAVFLAGATANAADTPTNASNGFELSAVVDVRRSHADGVPVLAVTPGGAGDRMGLRVGDRLQSVNGHSLAGTPDPAATLAHALQQSNGALSVRVLRGDQSLPLSGTADTRISTASEGCGFVTTLGPVPHVSRGIHQAEITMIDGRSTPLFAVNRHRLEAGRHILVVADRIEPHRLSSVQNQQISLMKRRESVRGYYKAIVVDIKPDTSYSIGAQLLRDRLDADSIRANAYWEPVVWQERPESCR